MSEQEKSAWLAERLMGFRNKEMGIGVGIRWWVDTHSSGEDRPRYPVAKWMRHPDMPYWNPFEDIRQAKEVQAAMRARGYRVRILSTFTVERDDNPRYGVAFECARDGMALVDAPTESEAICVAAGRALGWPFDD